MLFRERPANRSQESQGADPVPGANIPQIRRRGEALLAAGRDAIDNALSRDSQAFNNANRQEGGE